jgi:phosphoribosylglycinamide formyltransferase-1
MTKKRIAVLASGRGSNFLALAKEAQASDFPGEIVVLISDNVDAPVLTYAAQFGIEARWLDPGAKKTFLTPEVEIQWIEELRRRRVDLVCLAGFMRLIKPAMLEAFRGRILNIHPSLLPAFPGLDAQKQAWEYGAKMSGCTVHFVDDSLDGGPIIVQRCVPVREDDTADSLAERILAEEHKAYPYAVRLWCEGRLKIDGRRVIVTE